MCQVYRLYQLQPFATVVRLAIFVPTTHSLWQLLPAFVPWLCVHHPKHAVLETLKSGLSKITTTCILLRFGADRLSTKCPLVAET